MLNDCADVSRNPTETSSSLNGHDIQPSGEIRVLVSHSDPLIAAGLEAVLKEHRQLHVVLPRPVSEVARTDGEGAEADVIIADYESALRFSEAGRESRARIVIFTHSDAEAQICRALERGARGYLLLGCSAMELIEGIRSVYEGGVALGPRVARRVAESMKQRALTARQEDVLGQLMLGLSNKEIARKLTLTEGTVTIHVKAILAKLNATSRTEASAIAHRRGLLTHARDGNRQRPVVSEQLRHRKRMESNRGER